MMKGNSVRLFLLTALVASCADGAPNSCPVPNNSNILLQDGILQCSKGFHVTEIGIIDDFKNSATLYAEDINLTTATCGEIGWSIDGFFLDGVQLTSFVCVPNPARTDIFAEFGDDPCIDERVDSAFRGVGTKGPICAPGRDKKYIIRAVDADGNRVTFDNENWSSIIKWNDMWAYTWAWGSLNYTKPIVAATCARAGGVKCPCKPLGHLKNIGYSPNYPALPDLTGPCNQKDTWLYYNQLKAPTFGKTFLYSLDDANTALITCQAGMWMLYRNSDNNVWGIAGASCYKKS